MADQGIIAPTAGKGIDSICAVARLVAYQRKSPAHEIAQIQAARHDIFEPQQHPRIFKPGQSRLGKQNQRILAISLGQHLPVQPVGHNDIEAIAVRASLEIGDRINPVAPARNGYEHVIAILRRVSGELAGEEPRANPFDCAQSPRLNTIGAARFNRKDLHQLLVACAAGGSAKAEPNRVIPAKQIGNQIAGFRTNLDSVNCIAKR